MKNVLEYLENSAREHPKKVAVRDEKKALTFEKLLENSRRIGSFLADKNLLQQPVIVLGNKSADVLSAFFGVVYSGGYYVSLSPDLPEARLFQIQQVLGSKVILTETQNIYLAKKVVPQGEVVILSNAVKHRIDEEKLSQIRASAVSSNPLYANFTSGSTGVPKGVLVSHGSVIDFIDVFTKTFSFTESDIIGNQAPFDFDVSVKDIYTAMKVGAQLVIIPKRLFSAPADLIDYICDNNITVLIWAVSALCLISTFHALDYRVPSSVDKVLFSGEVMPLKHLNLWLERLPEAVFVNLYGPTEITCNCTYHIIQRGRDYSDGLPIGEPFENEDVFLLGENGKRICAPSQSGEICVRGDCLALGYCNSPEQTQKSFVQNPLVSSYPERVYKTGDLGMFNEKGELIFCGRKDFQIKHMGHRIELEEIEKAISALKSVDRCCCIYDEKKSKLYAFYTGSLPKGELHLKLKEKLPVFMIPNALRNIEALPLNANGKIDRKALRLKIQEKSHGK